MTSIKKMLEEGKRFKIVTYGACFFADNLRENPWVTALQKKWDADYPGQAKILIRGMGGVNSIWGLKNLKRRVIDAKPDIVFIEWSVNDAKNIKIGHQAGGISKQDCEKNLNEMVNRIKESLPDCKVVIWTTMPITTKGRDKSLDEYFDINRKYAKDNDLPLMDICAEFRKLKQENEKLYWMSLTEDEGHLTRFGANKVVLPFLLGKIDEEHI